ncbi:MAG: 23S rRNA (pseudouridine(1915)-N(3))-methyltransferase RlmH [Alphaproteobacteria bacterium]
MKISIYAIGKMKKDSPEMAIINEYVKRMSWTIEIKEFDAPPQYPKGAKIVALDERGDNISSIKFAQKIDNFILNGCSHIVFLIGGAEGHSQEVRDNADMLLSFGKMTLPHMLMRAVLMEQIYRAQTIINNHPYHRE